MHLSHLRLENLRNIEAADLALASGLNLFIGGNGAGKTSILEGAYLLSHARSFRTTQNDVLIKRGCARFAAFATVEDANGTTKLGMQRQVGRWSSRINGEAPAALADVLQHCAVVCFEPGSHALISGPAEERRRFLDWGVFHVEPGYLSVARRYQRVLKQRNALLKQGGSDLELDSWDVELAASAAPLADLREHYFSTWRELVAELLQIYLPELGPAAAHYRRGWSDSGALQDSLMADRQRDRLRGYTAHGPHRADWSLHFEQAPEREQFSRGQEKLCAIACILSQARLFSRTRGEWPIVALDDLPSELDIPHQHLVLDTLLASSAQVLITATEAVSLFAQIDPAIKQFHVEQGRVQALL